MAEGGAGDSTDDPMQMAMDAAGRMVHTGFIAQEVEAAAGKLHFDFSGVDKPAAPDGLYGLRYDNSVAPLVKAIQEVIDGRTAGSRQMVLIR